MSDRARTRELRGYALGYALALALSAAAFALVHWPIYAGTTTLAIILTVALAQMVVQLRFFLHITLARSSLADLQLILFSVLIIALMVSGTLVILLNLRLRMM